MPSGYAWESRKTSKWTTTGLSSEARLTHEAWTADSSLPALWRQTLVHSTFRAVVERSRRKIQRPLPAEVSRQGPHVVHEAASARIAGVRGEAQQHLSLQQAQRENPLKALAGMEKKLVFRARAMPQGTRWISRKKVAIICEVHPKQLPAEHLRRGVLDSARDPARIRCGYYRCQRTKAKALPGYDPDRRIQVSNAIMMIQVTSSCIPSLKALS